MTKRKRGIIWYNMVLIIKSRRPKSFGGVIPRKSDSNQTVVRQYFQNLKRVNIKILKKY